MTFKPIINKANTMHFNDAVNLLPIEMRVQWLKENSNIPPTLTITRQSKQYGFDEGNEVVVVDNPAYLTQLKLQQREADIETISHQVDSIYGSHMWIVEKPVVMNTIAQNKQMYCFSAIDPNGNVTLHKDSNDDFVATGMLTFIPFIILAFGTFGTLFEKKVSKVQKAIWATLFVACGLWVYYFIATPRPKLTSEFYGARALFPTGNDADNVASYTQWDEKAVVPVVFTNPTQEFIAMRRKVTEQKLQPIIIAHREAFSINWKGLHMAPPERVDPMLCIEIKGESGVPYIIALQKYGNLPGEAEFSKQMLTEYVRYQFNDSTLSLVK